MHNLTEDIRSDLTKLFSQKETVTNEAESFTFNRDGETIERELSDHDKYVIGTLAKLRELHSSLSNNGVDLKSHGSGGSALNVLYTDIMDELDRYVKFYMEIPALDGGEYDHSHPFLG